MQLEIELRESLTIIDLTFSFNLSYFTQLSNLTFTIICWWYLPRTHQSWLPHWVHCSLLDV